MILAETTHQKYTELIHIFNKMGSVLIAYSGGVDSSLLLKIGTDTLGENCIGIIGSSPSLASQEYEEAIKQAKQMGANLKTINTNEINNSLYILNDQDRCYFCKSELFGNLNKTAEELNINFIVEGSNFDDLDDFRPGRKAAEEKKIRSPLVEAKFSKEEIRELAKYLELKSWDKLSQPCLASRVAYGVQINENILDKINLAEIYLKELGFEIVRVRYFDNHVSVEVGKDEVSRLLSEDIKIVVTKEFNKIGFSNILFDSEGYQSGKLNKIHTTS